MPAKTVKVGISRTELVQEVHHWDPQSLQESLQGKDVTEAIREKVRDFMTRHGLTNIDDIRDKNGKGLTALHAASAWGLTEVMHVLLQPPFKANPNRELGSKGFTALHLASQEGHADTVAALLTIRNVNVKTGSSKDKITALHLASQEGHVEVVNALLKCSNINVNCKTQTGFTPLHLAVQHSQLDAVNALLQHKNLKINAHTKKGYTALHLAAENGNMNAALSLRKHNKMKLDMKTNNGKTAKDLAEENRHHQVAQALPSVGKHSGKRKIVPIQDTAVSKDEKGFLQTSIMGAVSPSPQTGDASEYFDRIVILHDGENCTIPRHSQADGSKLYDAVVREALEIATGKVLSVDTAIPGKVNVNWTLVMNHYSNSPMSIQPAVQDSLKTRGVIFVSPRRKPGDTDYTLLRIINMEIERLREQPSWKRTLVALLAADKDYADALTRLTQTNATVVMIHRGNAEPAFDGILWQRRKMINPTWERLVRSVSRNSNFNWDWNKTVRTNTRKMFKGRAVCCTVSTSYPCQRHLKVIYGKDFTTKLKQLDRRLQLEYARSKNHPNTITDLVVTMDSKAANEDDARKNGQQAERLLSEKLKNLTCCHLCVNSGKLCKESYSQAEQKGVTIWVADKTVHTESTRLYEEPAMEIESFSSDKNVVLKQIQTVAKRHGIFISNIQNLNRGNDETTSTSSWKVSFDLSSHSSCEIYTLMTRLAGEQIRADDGSELKFTGNHSLNSQSFFIFLVTEIGNEERFREVKNDILGFMGNTPQRMSECYNCRNQFTNEEGIRCFNGLHFLCKACLNKNVDSMSQNENLMNKGEEDIPCYCCNEEEREQAFFNPHLAIPLLKNETIQKYGDLKNSLSVNQSPVSPQRRKESECHDDHDHLNNKDGSASSCRCLIM